MKRSTWILLVVVAALGLFVALWERKQPSTDESQKAKGQLLPASTKEATALSRAGQEPIALAKKGDDWDITLPFADRADRFSVSGLLDRLTETEVTRWLDGSPAAEMGLDAPKATWTIQSQSGKTTVELGARAALEAGLYLRVNGRVALVAASIEDALLRPVSDFRSKELLTVGSADVTSFRCAEGNTERLAFSRQGDLWDITVPISDAGDGNKLETIIEDVCACLVDTFMEDNPKELARYGLEPPAREIRLKTKAGVEVVVRLGATVPGADPAKALVYAHASDRPSVFAISMNSLKSLAQDAEGLRLLDPFRHDAYSAKSLVLSGGAAITLAATKEGAWKIENPPKGVKAEEGAALFTALAGLKGQKVVAATQPFEPYLTLLLKGGGWEEKAEVGVEKEGVRLLKPAGRTIYLELEKEGWATAEAALAVATGEVPSPPPVTPAAPKPATASDPLPAPPPASSRAPAP